MRIRAKQGFRKLVTDEREHQSITDNNEYLVLAIDNDDYRILDDAGMPLLYPKAFFEVLDCSIPAGWQFREYEDGEYHIGPASTCSPGFYEDYFGSEGDHEAQVAAQKTIRDLLQRMLEDCDDAHRQLIERVLAR